MDNVPLTLDGIRQALYDLRDDYTNHLHDGTSTRTFQTIRAEAASLRALSIQKIGYADTTPGLWTGVSAAGVPQFNLGNSSSYIKFDGVNFSILGALSVTQLDIPDQTTANSFHTDSSGNSWWGANVASGSSSANASISSAGAAVFKNVTVGGTAVQYVITNSGIFSYGDGSDSDATCDGSTSVTGMSLSGSTYTLTRDVYFRNLTVNVGVTITGQYRIFCSISLTHNGTIHNNGNPGGNASNNVTGTNGAAVAAGYFQASAPGGSVVIGGNTANGGGVTTHSLGANGGSGGAGSVLISPAHVGQSGGPGGTASASNVKLIANWHLATLLDINIGSGGGTTALFQGGGGGGLGGFAGIGNNTGGGGAGSAAGIIAIYAKLLTIGGTGTITANGGGGGIGYQGGGGGGGGAGGIIVLVYNSLSNSGSITASGGTGGVGGAAVGGAYNAGVTGSDGSAGTIYQFQLSL